MIRVLVRAWRAVKYRRLLHRLAGPRLLRALADECPEAFFVEIGSNDGEQHDHLLPIILASGWRGIMVEPVPYVFERLKRNYAGVSRVTLENAAIAERDGRRPFFYLAQAEGPEREQLPSWYDTLGSFSREAVLGHAKHVDDIEERLVTTEVPCLTFESLCRKHGVGKVDVIVCDVEGYDARIMRAIDFAVYHPRLVVYEHYHLSAEERSDCRQYVEEAGYETMEEGFDTWCFDTEPDDRVSRVWRRLRPALPGASAEADRR